MNSFLIRGVAVWHWIDKAPPLALKIQTATEERVACGLAAPPCRGGKPKTPQSNATAATRGRLSACLDCL